MPLNIDLNKLRDLVNKEVEENNNRGESYNDSPYKIFYPGENGSFRVKLLYNMQANIVQRKIFRHDSGKSKIPCFSMFGESCPVCSKIKMIEDTIGKDSGVFRKYGYKARGICYAQIMYLDKTYQKRDNSPEVGDIVIMMYPVSLYNAINNLMTEAGEHLSDLVAENNGKSIVITRTQQGNGVPQYSAAVYAYGDEISYRDGSDPDDPSLTGDQIYENKVNGLPDLTDTVIQKYPTEKYRTDINALADTIHSEYLTGATIMNPGDEPMGHNAPTAESVAPTAAPATQPAPSAPVQTSAPAPTPSTNSGSSDNPPCYGNHKDGEKQCLLCPAETSCYIDSNN